MEHFSSVVESTFIFCIQDSHGMRLYCTITVSENITISGYMQTLTLRIQVYKTRTYIHSHTLLRICVYVQALSNSIYVCAGEVCVFGL